MIDGNGLPLSSLITAASTGETYIVETLVDTSVDGRQPDRLIYDKAADVNWLRKALQRRDIELICPHRKGRQSKPLQDGRSLRRYLRRWKVERTISWLRNSGGRRPACKYSRISRY